MVPRGEEATLRRAFNHQSYIEALISLFTVHRLPFSAIEYGAIKEFALACNPNIEDMLLSNRPMLMRHLKANYSLYSDQLKESLQKTMSMIHFSTDLWTSPHKHSMLAICVQWLDADYNLRKALLGLAECRHSHSGSTQAAIIMEYFEMYRITHRLGYHTADNATSNDTCLRAVSVTLRDEHNVTFDAVHRRVRCIGHIINLSLQAFLLARSKEALAAAIAAAESVADNKDIERLSTQLTAPSTPSQRGDTRSQGTTTNTASGDKCSGWEGIAPLRKLHTIAVWLDLSSLHSDMWRDAVGLEHGTDNITRWSSWYKVINNAIKKKAQINRFFTQYDHDLGENMLDTSDWVLLERTQIFPQVFDEATRDAERDHASVADVLQLMDAILQHYEDTKLKHSPDGPEPDPCMLHAIDMGWFVLDKYYALTDKAPVYTAALLLDPSRRLAYLEENWPTEWHAAAIDRAQQVWESEYKDFVLPEEVSIPAAPAVVQSAVTPLERLKQRTQPKTTVSTDRDTFDAFIREDAVDLHGSTALEWWCQPERRRRYPRLHRMAVDILSIPPESAEPERTFSGARRTTR
jgi:hypothetical protein